MKEKFVDMLKKSKVFDKVEINVIMAMIELERKGKIKNTASEIAKEARIGTTNAYKYLYKLSELGLVEYEEDKQKVFWLSRVNPFSRIISAITDEYLKRKAALKAAGELYKNIVVPVKVIKSPEIRRIEGFDEFERYVAYLSDLSEKEIAVISDTVPKDSFLILDAWKRARERGIKMRWIGNDLGEEDVSLLKKIGFEVRFYDEIFYPFIMAADWKNGVTVEELDDFSGFVFLNKQTDFQEKFEELWDRAGEIK